MSAFPISPGPGIAKEALFDLASYDYPLDEGRIAQTPAEPRDSARLLVWNARPGTAEHRCSATSRSFCGRMTCWSSTTPASFRPG